MQKLLCTFFLKFLRLGTLRAIKDLPSPQPPAGGRGDKGVVPRVIYENSAHAEMQMATSPLEPKPVL